MAQASGAFSVGMSAGLFAGEMPRHGLHRVQHTRLEGRFLGGRGPERTQVVGRFQAGASTPSGR